MRAVDCIGFAGAFTVGARLAGFDVVGVKSLDGFGTKVFEANRATTGNPSVEISEAGRWTPLGASIVFGNPPCSGFSAYSKPGSTGPAAEINHCMRKLFGHAAREVGEDGKPGPQIVLMESVQNAHTNGLSTMRSLVRGLSKATGQQYSTTHLLLDYHNVGSAQHRKRYFLIAHRVELASMPQLRAGPTVRERLRGRSALPRLDGSFSQKLVDLMQVVEWREGEPLQRILARTPRNKLPRSWKGVNLEALKGFSPRGHSYRVKADEPSRVIFGCHVIMRAHWEDNRLLSLDELSALMGYPKGWKWPYSQTATLHMMGKQVPVEAGRFVCAWALKSLESETSVRKASERTIEITRDGKETVAR